MQSCFMSFHESVARSGAFYEASSASVSWGNLTTLQLDLNESIAYGSCEIADFCTCELHLRIVSCYSWRRSS